METVSRGKHRLDLLRFAVVANKEEIDRPIIVDNTNLGFFRGPGSLIGLLLEEVIDWQSQNPARVLGITVNAWRMDHPVGLGKFALIGP